MFPLDKMLTKFCIAVVGRGPGINEWEKVRPQSRKGEFCGKTTWLTSAQPQASHAICPGNTHHTGKDIGKKNKQRSKDLLNTWEKSDNTTN